MALVFRTDQTTPLTNDQVDNNFKYLRDQITLKYSTSDFTSANISLKLRTTVSGQSSLDLAEANAINAWQLRDLAPSSSLPFSLHKSSFFVLSEDGDLPVGTVVGALNGNATSATLAASATKLATARNINGVAFDGTAAITVADSTKLPLSGGTMTGKLNLVAIADTYAPLNLGIAAPSNNAKVNGDVWATTSGIRYHLNGQTDQVASLNSPVFTGIPQAPGFTGTADQIITLSHLDATRTALNTTIALKANIASPSFTGAPVAPTASADSNSTQIATTQFVKTAVTSSATDLTSAYKTYSDNSIVEFSNAVNVLLSYKADLDSPELTGTPLAPTPASGNNSTRIATTAFTNTAIATLASNLNASIAALQDAIASTRPVPAASVFYIASSTVPYGYFEAAGQVTSTLTYHDLWVALGSPAPTIGDAVNTFRLPDLRGEFVRGWDHNRGLDTGRALRSSQSSSNLEHNHAVPGDDQLAFADGYGGWTSSSRGNFPYDARSNYGGGGAVWNTTTDGGNESRPHNVALMPIIKW